MEESTNSDTIPESKTVLNEDANTLESYINLITHFSRLNNQGNSEATDLPYSSFVNLEPIKRLTYLELNTLFRRYRILRKIITLFPEKARGIGYQLLDNSGEVFQENDKLILKAFEEATIYARLYGKSYLVFDSLRQYEKPLGQREELTGYLVKLDLIYENDFFTERGEIRYHKSRVLVFFGDKNYIDDIDINYADYSDSIIQSIFESYLDFVACNKFSQFALENLSYLTVGINDLTTKIRNSPSEVNSRLQLINDMRKTNRILAYDKLQEDVEFISQAITGIIDIVREVKSIFASETGYTHEMLFERTQKDGLGSGMQAQLVERFKEQKINVSWVKNHQLDNYEILFERLYGSEYKVEIPFALELTELEQAELEDKASARLERLIRNKVISVSEARTGYKGTRFTLNIELDDATFEREIASLISQNQQNSLDTESEKVTSGFSPDNLEESEKNPNINLDSEMTETEFDAISLTTHEEIENLIDLASK